jgi:beta-glucosidase
MRADIWLFAAIYFGAAEAAVSPNYTEGILSSGTSMIYNLFLSEYS